MNRLFRLRKGPSSQGRDTDRLYGPVTPTLGRHGEADGDRPAAGATRPPGPEAPPPGEPAGPTAGRPAGAERDAAGPQRPATLGLRIVGPTDADRRGPGRPGADALGSATPVPPAGHRAEGGVRSPMGPVSTLATARSLDSEEDEAVEADDESATRIDADLDLRPDAPAPAVQDPDALSASRPAMPAAPARPEPAMAASADPTSDSPALGGTEPETDRPDAAAGTQDREPREPVWTPAPARPPALRTEPDRRADRPAPADETAERPAGGVPARRRRGGFFRHYEADPAEGEPGAPRGTAVARSSGRGAGAGAGALMPYGGEPAGALPGFRLPPADLRFGTRSNNDTEQKSASLALLETFTPTKPKRRAELFAGRRREIERVISAIEEEQASVVIYGERGLGKTSLANIVCDSARKVGYLVVRCACSTDISFEEMMRTLFAGVSGRYLSSQAANREGHRVDTLAELLPPRAFGVTEVAAAGRHLTGGHALFVLDEFDRIRDERVKNYLAEVIKNLSDLACGISFLILGVSTTIEDLMGHHASIQRNVVGVRLPLMSPEEVDATIDLGEEASGVRFDREMRRAVVAFSGGMPYAVQLLCLYAGRNAVARGALAVEHTDLEGALRRALDDLDRAVVDIYEQATRCETSETMTDIVFAAAAAICDEYGRFAPCDVEEALDTRGREPLHGLTLRKALSKLCRPEHGEMLEDERTAAGETLYRFRNQLTRLYVFGRQARRRGVF